MYEGLTATASDISPHWGHCAEDVGRPEGGPQVTLFYRQVTMHRGLPFAVRIPNAETIKALQQARDGEGLDEYASLDDMKARLD